MKSSPLRLAPLLLLALLVGCAGTTKPIGDWPFPVPPGANTGAAQPNPTLPTLPQPPVIQPPPPSPLPPPVVTPPVISHPQHDNGGLAPDAQPPLLSGFPHSIEGSGVPAPVLALVKQARSAKQAKKYDQAEAALERALRIEPRNPWVWQQLAGLHLAMGSADQALAEARKSNSLARRNPWLEVENYRVMAAAAQSTGNAALAREAQARYEDRQRYLTTPPLKTPPASP